MTTTTRPTASWTRTRKSNPPEPKKARSGDIDGEGASSSKKKKSKKGGRKSELDMAALTDEQAALAALESNQLLHLRLRKLAFPHPVPVPHCNWTRAKGRHRRNQVALRHEKTEARRRKSLPGLRLVQAAMHLDYHWRRRFWTPPLPPRLNVGVTRSREWEAPMAPATTVTS